MSRLRSGEDGGNKEYDPITDDLNILPPWRIVQLRAAFFGEIFLELGKAVVCQAPWSRRRAREREARQNRI
jgi:hypothetical protein